MSDLFSGGLDLTVDKIDNVMELLEHGGYVRLHDGVLTGYIESSRDVSRVVEAWCEEKGVENRVRYGRQYDPRKPRLDEVTVTYMGMMDIAAITPNGRFRSSRNPKTEELRRSVDLFKFFTPLVLDADLKVIDGNQRLEWAQTSRVTHLPVIVVDATGRKAEVLRLVLNRASEFQRWEFSEVNETSDALPNLQPVLEPLGLFADNVLPITFFTNSMFSYTIDEANDQQKTYRQEEGLAKWAEYMRELQETRKKNKSEESHKRLESAKAATVALFDMDWSEEDLIMRKSADPYLKARRDEWEEIAAEITKRYDEQVIAKCGAVPVNTRRLSRQVIEDKREELREKTKKAQADYLNSLELVEIKKMKIGEIREILSKVESDIPPRMKKSEMIERIEALQKEVELNG